VKALRVDFETDSDDIFQLVNGNEDAGPGSKPDDHGIGDVAHDAAHFQQSKGQLDQAGHEGQEEDDLNQGNPVLGRQVCSEAEDDHAEGIGRTRNQVV
jgi:hypothetical protein